jgi:hypothetical protein
MTVQPFVGLSPPPSTFANFADVAQWCRALYQAFTNLKRGKSENVTTLTMAAGATSTVFKDVRLSPQSVVVLDPMTASAASFLRTPPGPYCLTANRANSQWTFTHVSNPASDLKFAVAIIG